MKTPRTRRSEADGTPPKVGTQPGKGRASTAAPPPEGPRIAPTPTLDTHEGRRRARAVVGLGLVGAVVLAGLFVVRAFRTEELEDFEDFGRDTPPVASPSRPDRAALEREASVALADARRAAQREDAALTLERLKRTMDAYPGTESAAQAAEALERGRQGLPLFVDVPLVIADLVDLPPTPEPTAVAVVDVAGPSTPSGPVDVQLGPPRVAPEPRRETGLSLETADRAPRPLPDGFRARPGVGVHPSGWPLEITADHDGAAMVLIPGGTFTMGRDDGPAEERPAHRVTLSPYYIDQHEVTVGQYRLFQQATGHPQSGNGAEGDPSLPITEVSARDAQAYARWAGKALPTEAQWEMAARTVDGRIHPWGPAPPSWDRPRTPGQIDPVMSFDLDLSPYGVFDLAGNAREWTADWFDPSYHAALAGTGPVSDPKGPANSSARIPLVTIKGGSPQWFSTRRAGMRPDARLPDLGFRCVLNLDGLATDPGAAPPAASPHALPPPGTVLF